VPDATAAHAQPGFFADVGLTEVLSVKSAVWSDDTAHHKLRLSDAPESFYCADAQGKVHRIQVGAVGATSATLTIRQFLGGTP
jgi:hypothetical protein